MNDTVCLESASHYDKKVKAYNSYGHDVIFGMSFEYVGANETLLDMGIGTAIAPQDTLSGCIEEPTAWGVSIFKHSPLYIMGLLETNSLELLKEQRLLTKGSDKVTYDMLFSVLICRYR